MVDLSRPRWRGRGNVDALTIQALETAERILGFTVTITQGSYNTSVSASGGTHAGGGALDFSTKGLTGQRKRRVVRVLRSVGFAAWLRTPDQGPWAEHIHAVLAGHPKLSPAAARQVTAYRAGRDGLARAGGDYHWRPDPLPVYQWRNPVRRPRGADVSHHQGRIGTDRLRAAKRDGLRWLYVKATEGTVVVDAEHDNTVAVARALGIPVGSYHFAHPEVGDAASEARAFLQVADVRPGDLAPMLDLERTGGLTRKQLTTWVGTFADVVEARAGVRPVIYTPFDLDSTHGLRLWVARYSSDNRWPNVPAPWTGWDLWQHTDGDDGRPNRIDGLGHVDLNTLRPGLTVADLTIGAADMAEAATDVSVWRRIIPNTKLAAQAMLRKIFNRTGRILDELEQMQAGLDATRAEIAELKALLEPPEPEPDVPATPEDDALGES